MLPIWVIYDHPSDYPDNYVARLWNSDSPTDTVLLADSLETIQEKLHEMGLLCMPRMDEDDPCIVEVWI